MSQPQGPFWTIFQDLKAGHITRREFIARATALGVGLPVTLFVLNSVHIPGVAAQDAPPAGRPTTGTEGLTRGAGGEVKLIQWQAATHAFIHVSTGTKDSLAASLVTEPLMNYDAGGALVATLVTEVPSIENGLLAETLDSVTYNLLDGVLWSDGQPLTADDVVFTWQWIMDEANQSVNFTVYEPIANVEALAPNQVKVTFKAPTIAWYVPFTSSYGGGIIPKHVWDGQDAIAVNAAFRTNPIGTGPYKIDDLKENDQVIYSINENYREANKPFFATVNLKGGGTADSAAQAVLQTGDWDFAWNLQVPQPILAEMESSGGKGKVVPLPATNVERLMLNFSNPDQEFEGERSNKNNPHPYNTDIAVRQAISLCVDRDTVSSQFYMGGTAEPSGKNILTGLAAYESPNTTWEFNVEKAKETLEAAGWVQDGDVRKKDGVELKMEYATSINAVRQQTQAVLTQSLEEAGFKVQLTQIDAGVFFDSAPGNEQTLSHFYRDVQMYTNGPVSPFPLPYVQDFYAGPEDVNIAQKVNGWAGVNTLRYRNPDFDAQYEIAQTSTDAEAVAAAFIAMNDIVINDFAAIPVVSRAAEKYAIINALSADNVAGSSWESLYWNIANWFKTA